MGVRMRGLLKVIGCAVAGTARPGQGGFLWGFLWVVFKALGA
jgi:hypothetical protein